MSDESNCDEGNCDESLTVIIRRGHGHLLHWVKDDWPYQELTESLTLTLPFYPPNIYVGMNLSNAT